MKKVFKFKTYKEFDEARQKAEDDNFPVVESYCDKESGIFNLTLITMYKAEVKS